MKASSSKKRSTPFIPNTYTSIETAMPKYNNLSILRRIDQHDLRSVRRVMTALDYSFKNKQEESLDAAEGESMYLTAMERAWVNSVLSLIRTHDDDYPLLRMAAKRFTEARMAPDSFVITAINELDQLAEESVLRVPVSHIKKYEEAVKWFSGLPKLKLPERREPINESQYLAPTLSQESSETPKKVELEQQE